MTDFDFQFSHQGFCELCEQDVTFKAKTPAFRSSLRCPSCDSVPRHRALYRMALAIVQSPADAEDVTQNAWLRAFGQSGQMVRYPMDAFGVREE